VPASSQGSFEIDQTLRLARDAVENDIARYRMFVFGTMAVVSSLLRVTGLSDQWVPSAFFLAAFAYAVLLRGFLRRYGNPPVLAFVTVFADLAACVSPFYLIRHVGSVGPNDNEATFAAYIIGPAMVLVLLINALRNNVATALSGALFALALYTITLQTLAGFHPAQIPVALFLVLAGLIGIASARQSRKNLDSFARLQLLRRYLPPEAVDRVMRDDPDSALALGGRLVTVTLLAADLRGFTSMSEKLPPTEVMTQLNAYHGAMIDVIERHGGAIDKFIGDGTLVVFGLAGSAKDAAASAVACAGAMLEALIAHNEERARAGHSPLAMGIGVHTGPVIAGNLGVPGRRLEFTVIGDAVNTVSRLEGQTKGTDSPVIISAETAALLPDSSGQLRELSPVSLRGKERSMRVFGFARPSIRPPA
jgi:class 3 adenylate cyclase